MKQQLLDKARARRTRPANTQSNDEDIFAHKSASPLQISDDFVRFDRQPGYQQLSMMQQAGAAFGVPEPFFRVHEGCAGATTRIEGRELVNFASYNYLDYSRHPDVVKAAADAAAHYGTSVSASRAVSGERPIHQQLEAAVARTYDVEDAVVFVSGHATNVSTLGYLLGPKDLILHDEWIHNSSPAKRDFLALMGIDNVYDSRSHGFAEDILADLAARQQRDPSVDARGVDVVLNSLAGEAIAQNLRVLKPFGRFCELGKRDFYENTPMGLRPFRNNLSYFGIDSDQLMKECPGLTTRLFREMMALFEDGTLAPLPYTTFDASQVVEAFRYMQQARQIGKVVVTHRVAEHTAEQTSASPGAGAAAMPNQRDALTANQKTLTIDPAGSYLVTGGLGGFGLRSAEWLAAMGARELVLLGRSGAASEEAQQGVSRLEAQGVNVHALACDVADDAALSKVFARFGKSADADGIAPLKGIIHAAAVIDDALIRHLDAERIQRVMTPKLEGARLLDRLSAEHALDFFVLYSSATTLFGNPGQSVYVAANHWLEGLAANRRARGLPATCARWGAIEDAGFLARNEKTREALKNRLGGDALMADHALACLGEMISADQQAQALGLPGRSLGVLELDWGALARFLPTAATPRFEEIARRAGEDDNSQAQQDDIAAALAGLSGEALQTAIVEILKGELSKILLIDASAIDVNKSVYDMGFDSLMGVELMTAVEARLGISIPVMMISEAATLWRLAERLMHKMGNTDGEEAESSAEDQAMAQLVKQHGGETATLTERGEMVSK
ncbi:hypothetical protein C8233_17895 [Halomonas sp. SF2003]|nr:hypothetical protein C8233_17895 [Halomonas sp. SF2003]